MSDALVCPWCQMEIVWDEEIGPEEECPHCLGPLTDYNSVTISGEEIAETAVVEEAGSEPEDWADGMLRDHVPQVPDVEDDVWRGYEQAVERILDEQEEAPECGQCRELMVFAGEMTVRQDLFTPAPGLPNFLQAPYKQKVHVCPSCFTMTYSLSDEERLAVVKRLGDAR